VCVRQTTITARSVMIRDQDLESEITRHCNLLERGDSAVDGHDQLRTIGSKLTHRFQRKPVSLGRAFGDVHARRIAPPDMTNQVNQYRGGTHAVRVIVAEDRDALSRSHGVGKSTTHFDRTKEILRRLEMIECGRCESRECIGIDAARSSNALQERAPRRSCRRTVRQYPPLQPALHRRQTTPMTRAHRPTVRPHRIFRELPSKPKETLP